MTACGGDTILKVFRQLAWLLTAGLWGLGAQASPWNMGMRSLPQADGGRTTVFYPTAMAEAQTQIGAFRMSWARDGEPARGNGRLIVISHGSGGSPWVHTDLARVLVGMGFVVAFPQHQGDNHLDQRHPGPASWDKRPREVSAVIDALAIHPYFSPVLKLDAVGVYGGSAGGHTALSLAGGKWSPARFRDHCRQHMAHDFSSCTGFLTLLRGNLFDGPKRWLAQAVINWRFDDARLRHDEDVRVRAAVAMVPFAADFDMETLRTPRIALGLVRAGRDVNQVPAFHIDAVRQACLPRCTDLMDLPDASHGAMLSPMPPLDPGSVAHALLADPPGFDRERAVHDLNERIGAFFIRHLKVEPLSPYSEDPPQSR